MEELERNIIIIALDNLIHSYNIALEDNEITQEYRDFLQTSIDLAYQIIYKFNKPQWNQL